MGTGIQLVRPSWIAASREAGQEADVAQHLVVIPKVDPLLQRLRNGSSARPSTGQAHLFWLFWDHLCFWDPASMGHELRSQRPGLNHA